ncbi:SH3 domain-containing protein [Jeotgalibacillus sp. S-D1]|uniref:SH3 domain-containing protein n=1 Tax=Jeotgalibacillus sp. S-D1 TaxID=2552189 RepID=UPI00140482AD|nr:SH3 domain-containing protein [Jeotgalibacillus sp. S-D1]
MKVMVSILSILLFLSALLPPFQVIQAANVTATISSDHVNLREGPGLSYPTVATGNNGDTYEVLNEEYGWLQLKLSNGKKGWVAQWLTVQNSAQQETASTQDTREVTTDQLRIRSDASTESEILGSLVEGDSISVQEDAGEWLRITSSDGTSGWVASEFISPSQERSDEDPDSESQGTISVDRLNVRDDFSSDSAVIGSLNQGDSVRIEKEQYGWLLVEGNGIKGWVSSTYVQYQSIQENEDEPIETSTLAGSSIVIMVDTLTVRNEPSRDGKAIGKVQKNESFTIKEESNDWYKIEYESGEQGWIASWFTEAGTGSSDSGEEELVTILYNGSNIRTQPSVESEVAARTDSGEQYTVLSQQGEWYEVELSEGNTGFIASWIVSGENEPIEEEESVEEQPAQEETADDPPPPAIESIADATIVIDAGHGGRDGGAIGAGGSLEKTLTLRTAEILYHKLSSTGANVIMTRQDDRYIDLQSRVAASNQHQADAFVSIHYDAIDDRSVKGFTTYYYGDVDNELAQSVHTGLEGQMALRNRGIQYGNFLVLRDNSIPAVLLELGYISNPSEEVTINNDHFREIATTGIYNGLVDYFSQ